jgi:hypothetical protein
MTLHGIDYAIGLLITVAAPTSTGATVMRQGHRLIVHPLQYCAERRATALDLMSFKPFNNKKI